MCAAFVRPNIEAMQGYVPGEQPQDRRYIKLNTNENPYPPSPRVLEALQAAICDDLRLYPDPLANAVRTRAAAVCGLQPENILVGNGSDELLSLILRSCIDPGDRVVYPYPTYSLYDTLVTIQDGEIVHVPYGADGDLPAGLADAAGRVTFVCHPNAPSGIPVPLNELRRLAEASSGLVVVDEAYVDFAEWSAIPLIASCKNVLVLRTFSKSFSLAGMRIGLALGNAEIIEQLMKVKDSYNVSRLSIVAAAAALDDYEWMLENARRIRATRTRLTHALRELRYEAADSHTNFVLARRRGEDQRKTYEGLKERGVLVRYFDTPELRDALRITVGTEEETDALLAALRQIAAT